MRAILFLGNRKITRGEDGVVNNILNDLYYGQVSGWERRPVRTAATREIDSKIEAEKRYFIEKMSVDDCQRFQALENLYTQSHEADETDAFYYGFRLGAKLLIAVFMNEGCDEKLIDSGCAKR